MSAQLEGLVGRKLVQCCAGYALKLDFESRPHYQLLIEAPLTFDEGPPLEPNSPDALTEAAALLLGSVKEVRLGRDGSLTVSFDSDVRIHVPSHDSYEAWQLTSDDGLLVVCTPGGELAIWTPEPQ